MKLCDYLAKCKYKSIKVGACDGSGFFYCDNLTKNTPKIIEFIGNRYLESAKKNLEETKNYFENFDTIWEERFAKMNLVKDKNWREKVIEDVPIKQRAEKRKYLEKKLKDLPKAIKQKKEQMELEKKQLPHEIKRLEKYIATFVPMLERKVVDKYDAISPDEKDTIIVRISGDERGKYWLITEYQDRNKKVKRRYGWWIK